MRQADKPKETFNNKEIESTFKNPKKKMFRVCFCGDEQRNLPFELIKPLNECGKRAPLKKGWRSG